MDVVADSGSSAEPPVASEPGSVKVGPPAAERRDDAAPVYRGVAPVVKPPPVRAHAAVPGALSLARRKPSRQSKLTSPSSVFPRRVFPHAEPMEPPPLRRAVPPNRSAVDPGGRQAAANRGASAKGGKRASSLANGRTPSPIDAPPSPAEGHAIQAGAPAAPAAGHPAPSAGNEVPASGRPASASGGTVVSVPPRGMVASVLDRLDGGREDLPARTLPPGVYGSNAAANVGDDPLPAGGQAAGVRRMGWIVPLVAAVVAAFVAGSAYLAVTDRLTQPSDLGRFAGAPVTVGAESGTPVTGGVVKPPAAGARSDAPVSEVSRPLGDPFGAVASGPTGRPTRVRVAAIGLDSSLESLHLGKDGALQPPKGYENAGWYADGTVPGGTGPAVIAGHVDSRSGPAVFYRLRELTTGDRIEVTRGGETVVFTVTRTAWYPKTKFPASRVYAPTPDRQLRLITCGGVFDRSLRSYQDNLVVYAVAG